MYRAGKNSIILSEASAKSARRLWRAETMRARVEGPAVSAGTTAKLNEKEDLSSRAKLLSIGVSFIYCLRQME
jgi:hypothetical protein